MLVCFYDCRTFKLEREVCRLAEAAVFCAQPLQSCGLCGVLLGVAAGFVCGLGEWRPERDGDFGRFHVEAI